MKGQPWQDETVQALKQGYDAELAALRSKLATVTSDIRKNYVPIIM